MYTEGSTEKAKKKNGIISIVIKFAIWIPVILLAMTIFGLSGQNGEESGGLSRKAASVVITVADQIHILDVTPETKESYMDKVEYPIRKCAHMSEYALLGLLIYLALRVDGMNRYYGKYVAFGMAVAFACTDEIHQLYVPGRSGRFTDVLFDSAGCLIALLICHVCGNLYTRKFQKNSRKNIAI